MRADAGKPPKAARVARAERAEQLLDVALELVYERGYRALSVQAIAEAAGITKPIVYRIYPSLPVLLAALFRREQKRTDELLDRIIPEHPGQREPAELILDSLVGILGAASAYPLTWRLILFPPEGAPAPVAVLLERRRESVVKRARRLVAWGLPYLAVEQPLDEDLVARLLVSWAEEYARIVLDHGPGVVDELVQSARLLLAAVAWK